MLKFLHKSTVFMLDFSHPVESQAYTEVFIEDSGSVVCMQIHNNPEDQNQKDGECILGQRQNSKLAK